MRPECWTGLDLLKTIMGIKLYILKMGKLYALSSPLFNYRFYPEVSCSEEVLSGP